MRFLTSKTLVLTISVFISYPAFSQSKVCELKDLTENGREPRIDLKLNGRDITILGWEHPSPLRRDQDVIIGYVNAARRAAQANDCIGAVQNLTAMLKNQSASCSASARIIAELIAVHTKHKTDTLGLELSPNMWPLEVKALESEYEVLNYFSSKCPTETKGIITKMALLFPGPVEVFEKAKKVKGQPLEDDELRDQTAKITAEMSALPHLDDNSFPLNQRSQARVILHGIAGGDLPSQSELENFVKMAGYSDDSKTLTKWVSLYRELNNITPLRNEKIATNIINGTGNYIVLIGRLHTKDLANRLINKCRGIALGKLPEPARSAK
jgi:hypothetical protein